MLGQEAHYYMLCIAYYTEFNLQIRNYAQKRRRWAVGEKIVNTRWTKKFMAIFALAERLPTSATLVARENCFTYLILSC